MTQPLVSVILPVYNAAPYLRQALDSIFEQTYTHFEVIAIDDHSSDDSKKILDHFARTDPRLRVASHKRNQGIVATMNEAIGLAQGEYLARMDGDDISFPQRFALQVAVLQTQPKVVLVAGGFEIIDEASEYLYREVLPTADGDLKRAMYLRNPIAHGSTMFRKSACLAAGLYSSDCGPTEDFELWGRLAEQGEFCATEAMLYRWRVNSQGITRSNGQQVVQNMDAHFAARWQHSFPALRSAADLRQAGRRYCQIYPKRGADMKHIMLTDNAQLAMKLLARGRLLAGLRQLTAVALSSRTGLRIAVRRVLIVSGGLSKRGLEKTGARRKSEA